MVTFFDNQLNGTLVRFLTPTDMVQVRAQHTTKYVALILLLFGYFLCESDLEVVRH